jgi:hypothetical protein
MRKTIQLALFTIVFLALAPAATAQEDSYYDAWRSVSGQRGTLKEEHGAVVFTVDAQGPIMVAHVGRDYVDFARFTRTKGERRTHRLVPLTRLVLRRSRVVQ